jgi:uncharacterized protein (DUF983 family)
MKKTRLYSVLFNKCPRCHKGNFFVMNNAFSFKNFMKQYERCPVCNENYMREVGFYYGAMYASYGVVILLGMSVLAITNLIFDWGIPGFLWGFTVSCFVLWPWLYRTGRLIWINIFVGPKK